MKYILYILSIFQCFSAYSQTYKSVTKIRAVTSPSADIVYVTPTNGFISTFRWNPSSTLPDDSVMVFSSSVVKTGRFEREVPYGEVSVKWFGAVGDGSHYDDTAIQKAATWMVRYQKQPTLFFPAGEYLLNRGIFFGYDNDGDGQFDFWTLKIKGVKKSYGFRGSSVETVIKVNNPVEFGFGIQNGKGVEIRDIGFFGVNFAGMSVDGLNMADTASTRWVDVGVRDNRNSPHAGIVIDPVSRAYKGGTSWMYPNWISYYHDIYDNGSSDITIDGCSFKQFVVGLCNSPTGIKQNGEVHKFQNLWFGYCKSAISNGQSQARTIECYGITAWVGVEVVFDSQRYGDWGASALFAKGVNIAGGVKWLVACDRFGLGNQNEFVDVHAELLYGIGGSLLQGHTGGNIKIENSELDLLGEQPGNSHRANIIANTPQLIISHSTVNRYSTGDPSPFYALCSHIVIENSQADILSAGAMTNNAGNYISTVGQNYEQNRYNNNGYINGDAAVGGANMLKQGDEFIVDKSYLDFNGMGYKVKRRFIGNSWSNVLYVITGTSYIGHDTTVFNVDHSYIDLIPLHSFPTANFVEDITGNWKKTEGVLGYVSSIDRDNNTITVTKTNRAVSIGYTTAGYVHNQTKYNIYPFMQIGDIVSGSNVIHNVVGEASQISILENAYFSHPAFPIGTWVKSISGDSIVLSQNAIYSQENSVIMNEMSWENIGYGGESMTTSNKNINKLAYKRGDIIYNIVSDNNSTYNPTISHWVCIKDGMMGISGRQPIWKSVLSN